MKDQQLLCAAQLAAALVPKVQPPHVGLIALFDEDHFAGLLPIRDFHTAFQTALDAVNYTDAVLICYASPPPWDELATYARLCTVTYNGAIHERPVRLAGLQCTAPAYPAAVLS